jgi:CxxC-x17-CxxC domain-containing protein
LFSDKTLVCRDCHKPFVFTVTEQQEYADRGYQNTPGRCPECLSVRRARNPQPQTYAASYEPRERQLHNAVCATCGKATQVPFLPRADRPVYCSDCYTQQRAAAGPRTASQARSGARW